MLNYQIKHYSELTVNEFHDLIALRIDTFIIEQNCPYQELDGKDKNSYHLIGKDDSNNLLSTARILPEGISYPEVSIGRVVVSKTKRGIGEGHTIMKVCMDFIKDKFGDVAVRLSAQAHLEKFYNSHQYISTGKTYLEDGIPHVEMLYKHKN